jgi:putative inorganic carbon (HCO3(-)) transporter
MRRLTHLVTDSEILIAPVTGLLLIFPTRAPILASAGLMALIGIWLMRWWARRSPLQYTPLNTALLLLLVMIPVAVWASAVRDLTAEALAYLLAGVILFGAVVHWTRQAGRAWWIWAGLVAVGLALAALAPLGMQVSDSKLFPLSTVYTRWAGRLPETINANVMAGALAILWPICLAGTQFQASGSKSHFSRITYYALRLIAIPCTLVLLGTLVLTQSRGAYLAAAASLLVLLSLHWPKAARVIVPLAVIVGLVGASLIGWDTVADQLTAGEATSGLDQRVEIWSRSIYAIQDFPFTGLGLGTFERVVAILYPLFLHPEGTVPHAHNLFLQVAVDLGLPGLIAYLALLGLTFASALSAHRSFRRKVDKALASLCAGCIAGLGGMCVHGLVDAATWGLKLAFIPWAVMGLVVALHRLAEEEETTGDQATGRQEVETQQI